ncbi:MAG: hypothetical protein DSY42_03040, partial [Aquifex sp.]
SPPIPVILKLSEEFKDTTIEIVYIDEGFNFADRLKIVDGKIVEEEDILDEIREEGEETINLSSFSLACYYYSYRTYFPYQVYLNLRLKLLFSS